MKPQRRWMKWVLAESAKPGSVSLPWQRSTRKAIATRRAQSDGRLRAEG